MIEQVDPALIEWSRAQFALTAMYHWIFVPLTLGLGIVMAIMETIYYRTGDDFWKQTAKFWMKIFGINFAIGVATGIILEFEFGTNWSNYSWFVGDIFGAPLAIEGILAFFMEATFIAIMFFGWDKVSKRFHLASTWLTILGATLSAVWILIANAWMQFPIGMEFNPDTARNEMVSFAGFFDIVTSPVAITKFFHTVFSGWLTGAVVTIGISGWYLLKKRHHRFAVQSMKVGAIFGLVSVILLLGSGDGSSVQVAKKQPMKLAAMEGLYRGGTHAPLVAFGVLDPTVDACEEGDEDPFLFHLSIPSGLSVLTHRDANAFVPGVKDILEGGYVTEENTIALSAEEKIQRGQIAIDALAKYRQARKDKQDDAAAEHLERLREYFPYFGYGYIKDPSELVPNVPLVFYAFHIMVFSSGAFLLLFVLTLFLIWIKKIDSQKWFLWFSILMVPLVYIAGQAGWVVAEVGRQPWAIQDILPVGAATSRLDVSSVQTTFFIFLGLFTILLIAEMKILFSAIKKGPDTGEINA